LGKINNFVDKHVVLSVILFSLLFVAAITVCGILFVVEMPQTIGLTLFTACQLVLSCIAIWVMRKLRVFDRDDFKLAKVGKGLLLGWQAIVFAVAIFFCGLSNSPRAVWFRHVR